MRAAALAFLTALCGCAQGAGRLRYDLTETPGRGWYLEAPASGRFAWRQSGPADADRLERWLSAGQPVFVRLSPRRPRLALVVGRDREQGLWILRDEGRERVVSDAWLRRRWGGWALPGVPAAAPVVTRQ